MTTQTRNDTRHDVADLGEQFRKATQSAAEQTRQTMGAAQEKMQENLNKVQQAQVEWAKMMFRISEQNAQVMTSAISSLWDANMAAVKFFTFGQEQLDRSVTRTIEQNKHARDEGIALLNETADLTRHNQAELYRLTQESLRTGLFYAAKTGRKETEPTAK